MDGDERLLSGRLPGDRECPPRGLKKLSGVWILSLFCGCFRVRSPKRGEYEEQSQASSRSEVCHSHQEQQCTANPLNHNSNVEIVQVFSEEERVESNFEDEEEDSEPLEDYEIGGYHPVSIGDVYDERYQVVEKLGWGVYSTVWRCRAEKGEIALKIQKSAPEYTNAALNEIQILKAIQEAKRDVEIVRLLEHFYVSGPHGNHVCMVFELLGPTLLREIQEIGRLEVRRVKKITSAILDCLTFIHERVRILHTDIKPENVLLLTDRGMDDRQEGIKLVDLGTAFFLDNQSARDIQTREYRCPEGILGVWPFLPTADIWSVGCLVFELLTSETLFDPQSPRPGDLFTKDESHLAQAVELLGNIPFELLQKRTRGQHWFTQLPSSPVSGANASLNSTFPQQDLSLANITVFPPSENVDAIARVLIENFSYPSHQALEISAFLKPLLKYQPEHRISATCALELPWLSFKNAKD